MRRALTQRQRDLLHRIGNGQASDLTNAEKVSAYALRNRYLVKIKGAGPTWNATLTLEGEYFHKHGTYPPKP